MRLAEILPSPPSFASLSKERPLISLSSGVLGCFPAAPIRGVISIVSTTVKEGRGAAGGPMFEIGFLPTVLFWLARDPRGLLYSLPSEPPTLFSDTCVTAEKRYDPHPVFSFSFFFFWRGLERSLRISLAVVLPRFWFPMLNFFRTIRRTFKSNTFSFRLSVLKIDCGQCRLSAPMLIYTFARVGIMTLAVGWDKRFQKHLNSPSCPDHCPFPASPLRPPLFPPSLRY